ncbi:multidrug ABC transporter ATP-binding protein [Capsulimonas corticalis]|uniref:Multidrug ABC transporter ATP-binding protein n=1 Tax=Capsulimonas corticalis TaxID=2219043 RepID=A0A402CYC9_9BACT|nr:ABC transporter ATP-binding protein [Capsulimonas corticalis]BDI31351.1 multidrug ABC transporter ATP-binding protein [Capsulimonas corticalis]
MHRQSLSISHPIDLSKADAGLLSPTLASAPDALRIHGLSKSFGKTSVLKELDLDVPRGSVYALLGRNGAGKSTLIQLMLGILQPTAGQIRVLGLDPVRDGVELRQRVGYIPERLPMYDWMTVEETLRFVSPHYRNWSMEDESRLVTTFRLDRTKKVRELSRGNIALLALVIAMAHDPELVLLDECTSGMDAIARSEFDRTVIDALHGSNRTVFFASHQIHEIERFCDWVGILHNGRLLLQAPVDSIKGSVKMLRVAGMDEEEATLRQSPNVLTARSAGREWLITVQDYDEMTPPKTFFSGSVKEAVDLSLEEIFVALVAKEEGRA